MNHVDIVIPVYDGLEETRRCLETVLHTVDPGWARLVLVNDCSPNPEITALLRAAAAADPAIVLLENDSNQGFVVTANRGMAHDSTRDVLLLNSDVEVANDWLHRLREAAYQLPAAGSITPFSNNATICSFPNFCEDNAPLFGLDVSELDACFAGEFGPDDAVEVPSGVGFCMYIRRDCLEQVGYFDADTFGRGYGEENDWCQRAEKAGWRNLHLANVFVYHKGRVSFAGEHHPRVEKAMQLLDSKYPAYHSEVASYIARDPCKEQRVRALMVLVAQQAKPRILAISHKLGGGAQQHVDELAAFYQDQALFLQITPDRDGQSVTLSLFDGGRRLKDGLYFDVDREYEQLLALLRGLGLGRIHFHHTMGLHPRLWLLGRELDCPYDLTIHDYFLINGNPTLTDKDARYVCESADDFDERCAGHYPLPEGVDGATWRANQQLLVENAERVIFPSADCGRRFQHFFNVKQPVVAWHPDYLLSQPYPAPRGPNGDAQPLKVLVMGAISREKGADVLEQVAVSLADREVEFHLLGYAYRALSDQVLTHGPYSNDDACELVEAIAPDVVWYPALWPETYSYTLSIALHLGLPVVVPDIGAFVERVAGRPLSFVCPWDRPVSEWHDFWQGLREAMAAHAAGSAMASDATSPAPDQFYREAYLQAASPRPGALGEEVLASLAGHYHAGRPELSRRERLLGRIWSLSRSPVVAKMISIVPFSVQRAIKRRLSSRPMHDIVREQ